ncbi:folate-binding protein YgfZ [Xenococcus sp. PCC 7305]|uniref:CAF17-like 4Fe-4S cluster assembly/insertion protein YgfZ n=1 Tax=Xenococcus sp. PCC 7305 TaxID=102125 RepID=UPI0002ACAE23|nr:folate-binding protein YgfZ [Xenococcus sp. PCC 7305]ELS05580.1 folate-binding protein YgfZ [Xenococcus sp. PCC 7305]
MNYQEVVICDRSNWGLLQITGEDRLNYLHNQSTNDFNSLQPGGGCETVFVTPTARTIDLATTYVTEDAVLAIVAPNRRKYLLEWLDKFIFPFDRVEVTDVSSDYALLTLIGTDSDRILSELGVNNLPELKPYNHQLISLDGTTVRLGVGSDLALPGYNIIVPREQAAKIRDLITAQQVREIGDREWEELRILQGRPAPDKELTEDYNPLEAGLWQTISFEKGCYIGQETIARLNTYNGVKQKLWGVKFADSDLQAMTEDSLAMGTPITLEDKKVGVLTSFAIANQKPFALAYVRTKAGGVGLSVEIGGFSGELVDLPFLHHPKLADNQASN